MLYLHIETSKERSCHTIYNHLFNRDSYWWLKDTWNKRALHAITNLQEQRN